MNVARTAADVLAEHTTLELECIGGSGPPSLRCIVPFE